MRSDAYSRLTEHRKLWVRWSRPMVMQNSRIRHDGQRGEEQSLKQVQNMMGMEQRDVPRTLTP